MVLPSGYLTVCHGIDGSFIDGLPFLKMVDLSMANCRFLFHLEPVDEAILESLPGKAFGTTQKADHDWAMTTG